MRTVCIQGCDTARQNFGRNLTFIGPCIVIYFHSKTNQMYQCIKFILYYIVLYYIILYCVTLSYVKLCYATLRYLKLRYVTLRYLKLCYVMLCYVMLLR